MLVLECGHELGRKLSQPIPKTAFCESCDRLKNKNGQTTRFRLDARTAEFETWDENTQMPIQHSRPMTQEEINYWTR